MEEYRRSLKLAPYATLLVSLAIVGVSTWFTLAAADSEDDSSFHAQARQLRLRIASRMESQAALLLGAAGLVAINPNIHRPDFRTYVARLHLDEVYKGTVGVGILQYLKSTEIPAFESRLRAEVGPGFAVYPTLKAKPRDDLYALLYVEPDRGTATPGFGFDMASEPVRREAIEKARDTGRPTLGRQIHFMHRDGTVEANAGFHLFMPVYRSGANPTTVEGRRSALVGLVFCPFRSEDLLTRILSEAPIEVSAAVYDGSSADGAPFFGSKPPSATAALRLEPASIDVGQHEWTISVWRKVSIGSDIGRTLPIVGIGICAILFLLSLAQTRARTQAERALTELQRAERAQRMLAESGQALSKSLDYRETLKVVAALAVPHIADWAAVDILGPDGAIQRVAMEHPDPKMIALAHEAERRWPTSIDEPEGLAKVLRTGEVVFIPKITEEMLAQSIADPERLALARQLHICSAIIVPIANRGKTYGALTLVSAESNRTFSSGDVELAQEIGLRSGIAVENSLNADTALRELEDKKEAEAEVRRLNQDLEGLVVARTQALAAANQELEAFCYSVSHDLRAPLRSVDGFTKVLLDDYGSVLDDEAKGYLDRVRQAARRMDELITALLVLSRITRTEMKLKPTDVSEIARLSADDHVSVAPPGTQFEIKQGMRANADPQMLRVVLDNLIGNALKFSANVPSPKVEIGSELVEGRQTFFVRDNGVGFNPAYESKLFLPFERLHSARDYPGSGVGLATVQRIVLKHGGKVWAKSKEGEGATFYFTLSS